MLYIYFKSCFIRSYIGTLVYPDASKGIFAFFLNISQHLYTVNENSIYLNVKLSKKV